MDQEADAGDDQNHQAGQMVEHESELCLERSGLNPGEVVPEDREAASPECSTLRRKPAGQ